MKLSVNWLKDFIETTASPEELANLLTMAGLEVDSINDAASAFSKVVVGEVLSVEKHPDADKLTVCQVDVGSEKLQIVCGAKNVAKGIKIPVAMIGAVLDNDFKIKKGKLRGVESCGMLCAEQELSLAEKSNGLMILPQDAPLGTNVYDYLSLDDKILEVDLTPNRGDCASMIGVARELSVALKTSLKDIEINKVSVDSTDKLNVELKDKTCHRFFGRVIKGVNTKVETPVWLKERLRRAGHRSINIAVDITNYVMLELGQPMHAFDLEKVDTGIIVRKAKSGEKLVLLNEEEVELNSDTTVVADKNKALAIAGVMGGLESSVSGNTKDIFLECALFDAKELSGVARSYGLHTDSAYRFERGVAYNLQEKAIERATELLISIAGGSAGEVTIKENTKFEPQNITLNFDRIKRILGVDISASNAIDILQSLEIKLISKNENANSAEFEVPAFRYDLQIEADLIEELLRIYGVDNVEETYKVPASKLVINKKATDLNRVKSFLIDRGFNETINYSFISKELEELFSPNSKSWHLANPISAEMSTMRTSLWPSLVMAAQYNNLRQVNNVNIFESANLYFEENGEVKEELVLAGLSQGSICGNWQIKERKLDFYDLKGTLEALFQSITKEKSFVFKPLEIYGLHPKQGAGIFYGDKQVGKLGIIHPNIAQKLKLTGPIYLFELNLSSILIEHDFVFKKPSRFPAVTRDLAYTVKNDILVGDIVEVIQQKMSDILASVHVFDVYTGEGIAKDSKSVGFSLLLQHATRTLKDEEVDKAISELSTILTRDFDAALRD